MISLTDILHRITEAHIEERNMVFQADKEMRAFVGLKKSRSEEENAIVLSQLINKHIDGLKSIEQEFIKAVNRHLPKKGRDSKKYTFIHQLKSVPSIINKVVLRNKSILDIGDLVRGAILFKSIDDVDRFVKTFNRRASNIITKYEYKKKGSDPTFGYYGSHHFDLRLNGLDTELQVMPLKLWKYKENPGGGHVYYDKWRVDPTKMPKIDRQASMKLFRLGNDGRNEQTISEIIGSVGGKQQMEDSSG